jgi:hypothetical protein
LEVAIDFPYGHNCRRDHLRALVEFPFGYASRNANKLFTDVRDNREPGLERAVSIHPAREQAIRPQGRLRHSIR